MGKKTLTNAHCLLELIEKAHVTNLKRFSGLQECQALARGFDWSQDAETLPTALIEHVRHLRKEQRDPAEREALRILRLASPRGAQILTTVADQLHDNELIAAFLAEDGGEIGRSVIVPFALVDTGLRWHVRAFDRKSGEFRDFVVTRIEAPTLLDEEPQANERPDNDIQWTRIVELDFVPHPRLERPEIIKMDYGMQDGAIRMRVRAAVAGYMLLRWSVDCSPDHRLKEEQYRLWLSDPLALYGVENAKLAPGYQAPSGPKKR